MKKIIIAILTLVITLNLAACGKAPEATNKNPETTVIKIGIVGEITEPWGPTIEALAKENIEIELVKFADYILPNQALVDGEIDLNAFQHVAFLNNEIKEKGFELTPIGNTMIAPLNLYSDKIKNVEEIKENDKIGIPNDVTNGGRAIKVLESAGLIEVDLAAKYVPGVKDITANPLNLEFIEVEASNLPSLLPDVAAAIINGNHASDNNLTQQDAIFTQDVTQIKPDNPYINVIVARTEDKDNELYKKVVGAYQTDATKEQLQKTYNGLYLPAWFE